MSTPTEPTSRLVWSTDKSQPTTRPHVGRDTFLVFTAPLAAHLATLGHLVEEIVLKGDKVYWRAPIAADADRVRYQETLKRLGDAKRLTQAKLMGGVCTGPRERVR